MKNLDECKNIIEIRAKQRGHADIDAVFTKLESKDLLATYIVVKSFDPEELVSIVNAMLSTCPRDVLDTWYKDYWTKVRVLVGDWTKVSNNIEFAACTENIAITYPMCSNSAEIKYLTNLLLPFETSILDLNTYETSHDSSYVISFNDVSISLGKYIVQLVHIFAEIYIEKGVLPNNPGISLSSQAPQNYSFSYDRIDGGATEVSTFTHIATAYLK